MSRIQKILLAVLVLLSTVPAFSNANQYVLYIDAGSSGSRIHLFEYQSTSGVPDIKDLLCDKTTPGLSSFADQPEQAGASLKKILDTANNFLQKNNINPQGVSIYVLATAGMRLLPQEKQQAIYNNVRTYLQQNTNYNIAAIKTISGEMEAVYGWVDINYLLENFQQHHQTIGAIDMGGDSTEIAFETADTTHPNDEIDMTIGNQHYRVFSKSFLGLGLDDSRSAMTDTTNAASCYPNGYAYRGNQSGAFNFYTCEAIYKNIIDKLKVMTNVIPHNDMSFIAFSGAYYTYNFFGVDKMPEQAFLINRVQFICNESWAQMKKDYPNVPEKYLATDCANAVYLYELFYNTYQLNNKLYIDSSLNNTPIDWPLGAAIYNLTQKEKK